MSAKEIIHAMHQIIATSVLPKQDGIYRYSADYNPISNKLYLVDGEEGLRASFEVLTKESKKETLNKIGGLGFLLENVVNCG
jgi:hypothetical protein